MIGYPDTRNFIVSVIGPRRADKAFSMYGIIKERQLNDGEYVFADLGRRSQNDVGEEKTSPSGPPALHGRVPEYIFLDEVQSLPDWQPSYTRSTRRSVTGPSSQPRLPR